MRDPRYLIARTYLAELPRDLSWQPLIDLPDAPPSSDGSQHIHVTRHHDGTIKSAVPMRQVTGEVWVQAPFTRGAISQRQDVWVDCPTGDV